MATSGTYTYNPSLGELTIYAYQLIGVRPTALLQEHMDTARMATNMMLANWSNRGVNLWQVSLVTVPLVAGTSTYSVDPSTVVILDAYIEYGSPAIDRIIMPVSRTEYASYPNKNQAGFPTVFWFDRLLSPTVTIWPVPDGSQTSLKYYKVDRIQDANMNGSQQVDIPPIWLDAFAYGLAQRLASIWAPDKVAMFKPLADEAYNIASAQNVETASQYISPQISGYWR
jgi:hypothetical protein